MGDRPIDIELMPSDGWRERPAPEPPTRSPGFFDTERGRLVLAAAVALLVGGALGWTLGRGSTPDAAGPAATTRTTVARPTETTIGEVLPEPGPESEPEPETPRTTRFRPIIAAPPTTPTSVASEVVAEWWIELPPRVVDVRAELVVTVSRTRLLSLELPSGRVSAREVDRQPFGPPTLYAGDGWVLLPSWEATLPSTLVRDAEPPAAVDLGAASELVGVTGSDTFWRVDDSLTAGRAGSVVEIDVEGVPTGTAFEIPDVPLLGDPAGGVLVEMAGDTFQVGPDGAARLTTGDLLAISATRAVVHECDEALACAHRVIDRTTGDRADVLLDATFGPDPDLGRPSWAPGGSGLSPTGDAVVTLWSQRDDEGRVRQSLGVLDLSIGSFTEFAVNRDLTPFVWSPEGTFVFFVDGGRLFAFDRDAGASFAVLPELVGVDTVAIRPPAG